MRHGIFFLSRLEQWENLKLNRETDANNFRIRKLTATDFSKGACQRKLIQIKCNKHNHTFLLQISKAWETVKRVGGKLFSRILVVLFRKVWVDFLFANFYRLTFKIVFVRPNHFTNFSWPLTSELDLNSVFDILIFIQFNLFRWLSRISKNSKTKTDSIKFSFSEKATKMCAIVLKVLKFAY